MGDLPNVNDLEWENDRPKREDVKLITNGVGAATEAHRRDLSPGIARIWNGLLAAEGTTADKVKILVGSAQDVDGKRVYLAEDAEEVGLLDTSGGGNYFAVKHKYTYDYYEKAFYSSVKYYRVRRDDYEVVVSTSPQDEAGGHVRVVSAHKYEGALCFNYSYRSHDEVLFGKEYVLNLARFQFNQVFTEVPGQWRPAPYTWHYKTVRVCLADDYTALPFNGLPVDLDVCVDIAALDTTYTLGAIKDMTALVDITIGVRVNAAAPNKLFMAVVDPTPNEALVKGKIELLGIPSTGSSED